MNKQKMPPSKPHPQEECRLNVLNSLQLLDSEAEVAFDDLAMLAAQICRAPIALVSIVAQDRQWFKACVGLDATETPRSQSFCSHAILSPMEALVVEDATKDVRFADNPLVTDDPHIRFYVGFPLITLDKQMPIGTLCVIDRVPRHIDQQTLGKLKILASQVEKLIHLREATVELSEKNAALEATHRQLRRLNRELARQADALSSSNQELEQFAYVASHDLQAPLRTVASFCELLRQEYGEQIDSKGLAYIDYAVDGATRLQSMVRDLLEFSQITSQRLRLANTPASEAYDVALLNLESAIEESRAVITCGELPEVWAEPRQLSRLFQNLISNAIKYRGESNPVIHIGVESRSDEFVIFVRDNGIGIAAEHQDRIFGIFKRLHNREQYAGTGIGLAVCRRIVDQFGGRIWVESDVGVGSTFLFTIKKSANEDAGGGAELCQTSAD